LAPVLAGIVLLTLAAPLRADEFTVTDQKFGPASKPNTLAWAIAQANASSAPDNVISIAEGLQIKVDNAAFFGVLQLARITRSVRIEGNNATLVGNPSFVTSSGDLITKDNPRKILSTDIPVQGSYSFVSIGDEVPTRTTYVVINNLNADGLNQFARVEKTARLDFTGGSITRSVNFTDQTVYSPGFDVQLAGELNVTGLQANGNYALNNDGAYQGFFLVDAGARLNIAHSVVRNSKTGGVIFLNGGTAKVVSSIFSGAGGVTVASRANSFGAANIVNSFIFLAGASALQDGLDGELLPNKITALSGSTVNLTASTVVADLFSLDTEPAVFADGIPLDAEDGGTINLESSAVMATIDEANFSGQIAYNNAGLSTPGTLTADEWSWVRSTPTQSEGALRALFAQPTLRTDRSGALYVATLSASPRIEAMPTYPNASYPIEGGILIDVVPNADGANRLVNPIDGSFIDTDVFGDPRTTVGKRNIGAVQVKRVPDPSPQLLGNSDLNILWPPDHKMVAVQVSLRAIDDETPVADLFLMLKVTVSSDEVDSRNRGDREGDVDGFDGFTAPVDVTDMFRLNDATGVIEGTIYLRAERFGNGRGRTYTLEAKVTDDDGLEGSVILEIKVPHDLR